jgi:hypothetical protein
MSTGRKASLDLARPVIYHRHPCSTLVRPTLRPRYDGSARAKQASGEGRVCTLVLLVVSSAFAYFYLRRLSLFAKWLDVDVPLAALYVRMQRMVGIFIHHTETCWWLAVATMGITSRT